MNTVLLTIASALIVSFPTAILFKHLAGLPRDVRLNNLEIRAASEDLEIWMALEEEEMRSAFFAWDLADVGGHRSTYATARRKDRRKREAIKAFEARRLDLHRLRDRIGVGENFTHRLWRRAASRPLPPTSSETIKSLWLRWTEPETPWAPDSKLLAQLTHEGKTEIPASIVAGIDPPSGM